MRRSVAGRALVPLIGLWLMSNSGFFVVAAPCRMHAAMGSTHESMRMPASEQHSHDAQHDHGPKPSTPHGCECAGTCLSLSQQLALFDVAALPESVGPSAALKPTQPNTRPRHAVRDLPVATGPPSSLHT